MKTQKTIIFTLLGTIILTGCQATYSDSLSQKLSNKSQKEKNTILASECANEIEATRQKYKEASTQHSERMKEICNRMTKGSIKADK